MCKGSGEKYIKCHETNTYSENDIFTKLSHSFKIHHFYIHWYFGLPQSIELDIGMITHKFGKSVELNLNRTLDYHIWIMDPRMQVFSQIPETFPRARIDLLQNKTTTVFLKVNVGAHSIDFILRSDRISILYIVIKSKEFCWCTPSLQDKMACSEFKTHIIFHAGHQT